MSTKTLICPNCSNEINWYKQVKIKTKDGNEKVNKCPKCNGYFKASVPYDFWWSQLAFVPMAWHILIPEKFEIFKYSIFTILIIIIPILLFVRWRKNKRIAQEKGYWVVVKNSDAEK